MDSLKVMKLDTCCGCMSLRTGGIVIGVMNALSFLIASPQFDFLVFPGFIGLGVSLCYLYGIFKNKHQLMVPNLVYMWASFGLLVLFVIILIIAIAIGTGAELLDYVRIFFHPNDGYSEEVTVVFVIAIWIVFALSAAIQLYLALVVQTLFNSIKDNGHQIVPTNNDGVVNINCS